MSFRRTAILWRSCRIVDFELFRPVPIEALGPGDRSKGGRPPFDAILKFKMLYLQAQHGLSFEHIWFAIDFFG
ncbi:MAG: hypothetical protein ACXWVS_12915 [Hyphomicrobium sp.]